MLSAGVSKRWLYETVQHVTYSSYRMQYSACLYTRRSKEQAVRIAAAVTSHQNLALPRTAGQSRNLRLRRITATELPSRCLARPARHSPQLLGRGGTSQIWAPSIRIGHETTGPG